jgi:dsRNA-specific ribonuclease
MIDGEQLGIGTGESKKEAEQGAAKEALVKLGVEVSAA